MHTHSSTGGQDRPKRWLLEKKFVWMFIFSSFLFSLFETESHFQERDMECSILKDMYKLN